MSDKTKIAQGFSERAFQVRARTWVLTLVLVITLLFYVLFTTFLKQEVNFVDLVIISAIGIVVHFIYFPDGEIYGQKNPIFINNKTAYNQKATAINENRLVGKLKEYCEFEYEERKEKWIKNEIGAIGIDFEDFDNFKTLSPKQVSKLEYFDYKGRMYHFTKQSRKRLYRLLFREPPIERNEVNTILSATETSYVHSIKDTSISYRNKAYIKKIFLAVVVGTFLAYIGYTLQDGITLEKVAKLMFDLCSMVTTAVLSYSQGETCQKVHKNKFYVDLAQYIDKFNEWLYTNKQE